MIGHRSWSLRKRGLHPFCAQTASCPTLLSFASRSSRHNIKKKKKFLVQIFNILKKRFPVGLRIGHVIRLILHQSTGCSLTDQWKQSLRNSSVILLRAGASYRVLFLKCTRNWLKQWVLVPSDTNKLHCCSPSEDICRVLRVKTNNHSWHFSPNYVNSHRAQCQESWYHQAKTAVV